MLLSISLVAVAAMLQTSVAGPAARNAHGAAYDLRDSSLVLFGGATADAVRGDTWRWKHGSWRLVTGTGPDPRTFPTMVYDAARSEIVLFGGNRVLFGDSTHPAAMLGDTWVLRGDTWCARSADGPPARAEAAMAYDPVRRRTVLFGGRDEVAGQTIRLGDTWEWDGSSWTRVNTTGPSARSGAVMAYDPRRRAIVLFGGSGGPRGDTWTWNGREWDSVPMPPAPGRFNAVMAWDPTAGRLVRFGGWDGEGRTSETWELRDDRWVSLEASGPSARNHAAMVTATDRGSLLLYGGHDGDYIFGDLWERWRGAWVRRQSAAAVRRVANGH
jgi:hypothetical protein